MKLNNRIEVSQNQEKIWKIMTSSNKKATGWLTAKIKR